MNYYLSLPLSPTSMVCYKNKTFILCQKANVRSKEVNYPVDF